MQFCLLGVFSIWPSTSVLPLPFAGTVFYLQEDSAHLCLSISDDGLSIFYGEEELPISALASDENMFSRWSAEWEPWLKNSNAKELCDHSSRVHRCIAVLGNLIPVRGRLYWEVEVDETTEFRIGVAYEDTERNSYLGANNTSWCMRHVLTPTR